jgi:hypothetical protein
LVRYQLNFGLVLSRRGKSHGIRRARASFDRLTRRLLRFSSPPAFRVVDNRASAEKKKAHADAGFAVVRRIFNESSFVVARSRIDQAIILHQWNRMRTVRQMA